ncbi:MAG: hypothetical protein F6K32_03680 [Desertifilum sp. SIO1I2]|nr:hypothetical protein [Desertifilum sp. SIO1I2]
MTDPSDFIYPRSTYRGDFTPENLMFNANLQEFAQRVSIVCNLETNGKVSSETAYQQIKDLWQQLKISKDNLGISQQDGHSPDT